MSGNALTTESIQGMLYFDAILAAGMPSADVSGPIIPDTRGNFLLLKRFSKYSTTSVTLLCVSKHSIDALNGQEVSLTTIELK